MKMDPNLLTIRNANRKFIQQGRLSVPIVQAKSYLFYILGEDNKVQIEREIKEFKEHLQSLVPTKVEHAIRSKKTHDPRRSSSRQIVQTKRGSTSTACQR